MSSEKSPENTSADDAEDHEHVGIRVTTETEDGVQEEESNEDDSIVDEADNDVDPVDDLDIDDVEAVDDEDETKSGESSGDDEEDSVDTKDKKLIKKKSSFVYSFTSKNYRRVDAHIDEFDDADLDDAEIVKATDSLEDSGVTFVRLHGGEEPEDTEESFRGSLRDKDSSYDLIISEDQIRMTWATRTNHEWKVAHSKSIFPEHVTEMDYYKYDVQTNHGGCIAMCCSCRCPRIAYSMRCCRLSF